MKKFWNWKTALMGVVTALLMSVIAAVSFYFYCAYLMKNTNATHVVVMENAQENEGSVISMTQSGEDAQIEVDATPSVETLKNLYGYVYVLYKELCDNQRRREGKEPYVRYQDLIYDPVTALNLPNGSEENAAEIRNAYETAVTESRTRVENRLAAMESSFYEFNNRYDYWMFDEKYPAYVLTNTDHVEISSINSSPYAYLFRIDYDKNGVATISNRILQGTDREKIRKNLNTLLHEKPKVILGGDVGEEYGSDVLQSALEKATSVKNPASCSVIMGITWDKYRSAYGIQTEREEEAYFRANFHTLSVRVFAAILFGAGALWGAFWLNPGKEEKRADRILARAPFELVVALIFLVYSGGYMLQEWLAELVLAERLDYVSAWIYVFFLCLVTWYAGGCLGEMRILGPGGYLKKRWILLMGLRALGRHLRKVYDDYRSLNLGMNLRKRIIALVVINGVLVSIFCCGWFLGIIAVII